MATMIFFYSILNAEPSALGLGTLLFRLMNVCSSAFLALPGGVRASKLAGFHACGALDMQSYAAVTAVKNSIDTREAYGLPVFLLWLTTWIYISPVIVQACVTPFALFGVVCVCLFLFGGVQPSEVLSVLSTNDCLPSPSCVVVQMVVAVACVSAILLHSERSSEVGIEASNKLSSVWTRLTECESYISMEFIVACLWIVPNILQLFFVFWTFYSRARNCMLRRSSGSGGSATL